MQMCVENRNFSRRLPRRSRNFLPSIQHRPLVTSELISRALPAVALTPHPRSTCNPEMEGLHISVNLGFPVQLVAEHNLIELFFFSLKGN